MKNLIIPMLAAVIGYQLLSRGLNMKISEKGISLIKIGEGLSLEPYHDAAGHITIGYGHKILPHESFTKINQAQAEGILKQDLSFAEKAVNSHVKNPLTQNEYDALVSFVFNVGETNFKNSTLLSALNSLYAKAQNYTAAKKAVFSHELPRWNKVTDPVTGKKLENAGLDRRGS